MKPTITCGQHLAQNCDLTASEFDDVCLKNASFNNINLSNAHFHNINFSDTTITAANLGGVTFKHIGPAPDADGNFPPQRPVTFTDADLNSSTFNNVDLANVQINNCNTEGLKIDGIDIADLFDAYNKQNA